MDAKWTEILSAWGTESADIRLRKPGVWEIDQRFMLKAYEDEKSLERNVQFLTVLAECGAPSARIIKTRDGEAYGKTGGKCWLMTAKLPGNSLADIRDPGAAEKMGETIARLHAILRKCEKKLTLWDNSLLDEMEGWVRQTLQQNGWKPVSRQEWLSVTERLRDLYSGLPRQLIHRDVHFGNFLFQNGEFSGYLDFDLSQRNIRIFDPAYFLTGLLAQEGGSKLSTQEWLEITASVLSGYESVDGLKQEEKAALPCVMESIEILFAAYFASVGNPDTAAEAAKLFHRIRGAEDRIRKALT